MAVGPNEQRLRDYLQPARKEQVLLARQFWTEGATTLATVADAVQRARPLARENLGNHTADAADAAFVSMYDKVLAREKQMQRGATALGRAVGAIRRATAVRDRFDDEGPINEPNPPDWDEDEIRQIQQLKSHNARMSSYHGQADAREEAAAAAIRDMDETHQGSAATMREIQGERPETAGSSSGSGAGGGGRAGGAPPSAGSGAGSGGTPLTPTYGSPHDPPRDPPTPPTDPPGNPPGNPPMVPSGVPAGPPTGGETGTPQGPGVTANPTPAAPAAVASSGAVGSTGNLGGIAGAVGGGVAGGAIGMGGAIRGGGAGAAAPAGASRAIGSSGRSGAAGPLGRSAAASPGARTGATGRGTGAPARGGSARGAGGGTGSRGAGKGVGRGGAGRGGTGGAGGRGGRKSPDEKRSKSEANLDDQDWLDDEDAAPGVID